MGGEELRERGKVGGEERGGRGGKKGPIYIVPGVIM